MSVLPYDYARCVGVAHLRACKECLRMNDQGREKWQPYIVNTPDEHGVCKLQIKEYNGRTVEDALSEILKGSELIAYTDYPIPELGDKFYSKAPMRECYVLSYDGEFYELIVEGVNQWIRCKNVYATNTRGDVLSPTLLNNDNTD